MSGKRIEAFGGRTRWATGPHGRLDVVANRPSEGY